MSQEQLRRPSPVYHPRTHTPSPSATRGCCCCPSCSCPKHSSSCCHTPPTCCCPQHASRAAALANPHTHKHIPPHKMQLQQTLIPTNTSHHLLQLTVERTTARTATNSCLRLHQLRDSAVAFAGVAVAACRQPAAVHAASAAAVLLRSCQSAASCGAVCGCWCSSWLPPPLSLAMTVSFQLPRPLLLLLLLLGPGRLLMPVTPRWTAQCPPGSSHQAPLHRITQHSSCVSGMSTQATTVFGVTAVCC